MITSINNFTYSPSFKNFQTKSEATSTIDIAADETLDKESKKFKFKKYSELSDKQKKGVLYASIALAGLTGIAIGRGRRNSIATFAYDELRRTSSRLCDATDELTRVKAELEDLRAVYESSTGSESTLKRVTAELREKFAELVESDLSPKEIREQIFLSMKSLIDDVPLNYDPMSPPITGKGITKFADAIELLGNFILLFQKVK